ncbi:MAG: Ig domain-containing protein [Candidatus Marinimicrobia bacterium]|nr:Ig domain-containing protein [Candidatus Neomarinimicrobiota bacterium]MCF7827991.1 Ig domain-containing protein [Candidatus Neomarinimicrobiota bacterium]MCF7879254.1 Ig domain-containing protein [Candidatus Neomarinimicrobiota bacterium]
MQGVTITKHFLPAATDIPNQIEIGLDANSNGITEVVILHEALQGQHVTCYELTEPQATKIWEFRLPQTLQGDVVDIQSADTDGDGNREILCLANVISSDGAPDNIPWLFAFEWNGNTFAETGTSRWSYQVSPGMNLRPKNFCVSDFDNDSKQELAVIFGSPERIGLIVQREGTLQSGAWTPEFQFPVPGNGQSGFDVHLTAADLTADGVDELLLYSTNVDAQVSVYSYIDANRYAPVTTIPFPPMMSSTEAFPLLAATDMDGNGYNDILLGTQSGTLHRLSRSTPQQEIFQFNPQVLSRTGSQLSTLQAIDGKVIFTREGSDVVSQGTISDGQFETIQLQPDKFAGYQFSASASANSSPTMVLAGSAAGSAPALFSLQWERSTPSLAEKADMNATTQTRTPDQVAYIGKWYVYPIDFDILSVDNLNIEFAKAPKGMRYNHQASRLEWTPQSSQKGFHQVEINIRSAQYEHSEQFVVLAKEDPPSISSDPVTIVTAGEPWEYQVTVANSSAYETLKYSLLDAPDNMTINSQGWLYWVPSVGQVNDQQVTVAVSDGYDIDTQTFAVYVNAPPSFLSQPGTTTSINEEYTYNIQTGDRNEDSRVSISLRQGPEGMSLTDRQLSWIPTGDQVGNFTVMLELTDNYIATAQRWTLFVNAPPKITSTPPDSLPYDQEYRYQVDVSDPNAEQGLSYSLVHAPQGMTIDNNGLVTWRPGKGSINRQTFTCRVSDGYAEDTQTGEVFINVPPEFVSEPERVAVSELRYTYALQGEDANGDAITFSSIQLPKYASLDTSINTLSWKPTMGQIGEQRFRLQVTDAHGATTIQEFNVRVYENPGTKPLVFSGYYILIALVGGLFVLTTTL